MWIWWHKWGWYVHIEAHGSFKTLLVSLYLSSKFVQHLFPVKQTSLHKSGCSWFYFTMQENIGRERNHGQSYKKIKRINEFKSNVSACTKGSGVAVKYVVLTRWLIHISKRMLLEGTRLKCTKFAICWPSQEKNSTPPPPPPKLLDQFRWFCFHQRPSSHCQEQWVNEDTEMISPSIHFCQVQQKLNALTLPYAYFQINSPVRRATSMVR